MPILEQGFSKDKHVRAEVISLAIEHELTTAVETGTYLGYTTNELAKIFEVVHTIEIKSEFSIQAQKNCQHQNVNFIVGDSRKHIRNCLTDNCFVYLDAHWGVNPLVEELKEIAASGFKPVIAIHDFKVPGKNFKHDGLTFEMIEPHLKMIYGKFGYHYNKKASGKKVGIIYIYEAM